MARAIKEVPSHHDFLDADYVKRWTESVVRHRPERKEIFKRFIAEANKIDKTKLSVLEIGCGPGFLAEQLLSHCDIGRYFLFDLSPHMLKLSRERLGESADRAAFVEGDFKKKNWAASFPVGFGLVVALQSIHELRHASRIPTVYAEIFRLLAPGGSFLVCDHVNSRLPARHRSAHFMTVEEHLATMSKAGFSGAREVYAAADLSLMRGDKPRATT